MGEGAPGVRRISLQTTIQLTLAAVLATVIAVGLAVHVFLVHRNLNRAREAAALMTAEAIKTHVQADAQSVAGNPQQLCTRLLGQPTVLATALCGVGGRVLACAAVDENAEALVTAPACTAGGTAYTTEQIELPGWDHRGPAAAERVAMDLAIPGRPDGPARIVVLLAIPSVLAEADRGLGLIAAAMTGAGVGAFLIGATHLKRRVLRPIMRLTEALASGKPAAAEDAVLDTVEEIEAVAQSLTQLQEKLGDWRERAERIERRFDWRIAAETQRITRDLRRVQREAWRDPLTGLNNRRLLDEKLPEIFTAQLSARQDLSVVMLDIDHFKSLNDTLGHQAGDDVLVFAGQLLRECLRADDVAVRYGGDEFLLVLPGLSAQNALTMVSRLVALFAQRVKVMVNVQPAPTLSAGIASLHYNRPADYTKLLQMADRALYQAKRAGKATVRICTGVERHVA